MNWLRKMMQGRHGNDPLNIALMVFYLVLSLLSQILRISIIGYVSLIFMALCFYRMFSRDLSKRYAENAKFMGVFNRVKHWFQGKVNRLKGMKTHRYFTCPKCKKTLRVPKGRGNICITCPSCKNEFVRKT